MDGESCGGKGRVGDYRLCVGEDVTDFLIFWVGRKKRVVGHKKEGKGPTKNIWCAHQKKQSLSRKKRMWCAH